MRSFLADGLVCGVPRTLLTSNPTPSRHSLVTSLERRRIWGFFDIMYL
jgi:hypothetical protein